jgi:hypothetical protein
MSGFAWILGTSASSSAIAGAPGGATRDSRMPARTTSTAPFRRELWGDPSNLCAPIVPAASARFHADPQVDRKTLWEEGYDDSSH